MAVEKKAPLERIKGGIYLRDRRNGMVHPYEPLLAQMSYMDRFVEGEDDPAVNTFGENKITLSGLERAALFDKVAAMKGSQREKYLGSLAQHEVLTMADMGIPEAQEIRKNMKATTPQQEEGMSNEPPSKKKYRATEKAQFPVEEYLGKGWTKEQLLEHELIEEVNE